MTEINFTPRNDKDIAGLALLQKEDYKFQIENDWDSTFLKNSEKKN